MTDRFLRVWDRRGLSHDLPEYQFAKRMRKLADQIYAGEDSDLTEYAPKKLRDEALDGFERVLYERWPVRHWDWPRRVPDEIIDKALKAGF